MKKSILIVLVLLFQSGFAQEKLSETQKLAATAKIWGFLKYYHPNVADGKTNWDDQLFDILPQVEEAQTKEEFSTVLENWIASLGEVKSYKTTKPDQKADYFYKNFDLSWIKKKELFSKSLSIKLKFIEENRIQGKQFYVDYLRDGGVPLQFKNEINYPDFKWTDKNLRLLALFRYWNYIEYFFPYKYQMDQNWDSALTEMMPRFSNSESEKDFVLAMREISVKLNDTHASTQTSKLFEYFGDKWIPVDVKFIDGKAVVTNFKNDSLARIDDIKVGDVITKMDGKTITQIITEKQKYVEGSNFPSILKNFNWHVFCGNSDSIEIEFSRDGKTAVKTINRYSYQNLKITFKDQDKWKLLDDNIGYADLGALDVNDIPALIEQFNNTKAMVFDVRSRPHDVMYQISEWLNPEPKEFARFLEPDLSFPSRYIWKEEIEKCGNNNQNYYKGKVIFLVNEEAISHSEFTIMALKTAPKATIIGSQTGGADGANYRFEIIKGFRSSFTCQGVFYPNKKETQRIGIIPDIEVKPSIKGIQEGKDEVLDRAIKFIETGS
jgi:C-terminal processing protease CtpA/Prc